MDKLLFISDSYQLPTGYSVVAKNLYNILKDDYEIRFFSTLPHRQISKEPFNYVAPDTNYATHFERVIQTFKPDIVLSISDLWRLDFIVTTKIKYPFRWIAYLPVEGKEYPRKIYSLNKWHNLITYLSYVDLPIAYSKFGLEEIQKVFSGIKDYIYLGVDNSIFKITNRIDSPFPEDKFVFFACGDNYKRKRYDLLLKAWKRFINPKINAVLFILTDIVNEFAGWDLAELRRRNDIEDTVYLANDYKKGIGIDIQEIVRYYNCCDCYITVSGGEGWNLSVLEAMACGLPVIYTNYGTMPEYVGDSGLSIQIKGTCPAAPENIEFAEIDIESAVSAMRNIYEKSNLRNKFKEKGLVLAKQLDWKEQKINWVKAIEDTLRKSLKYGVII